MKVKATEKGYYGRLRSPGDVFDVQDGAVASWFEKVEGDEQSSPETDLKGVSIADLREMAEAEGIDHDGMSKAELREALDGA